MVASTWPLVIPPTRPTRPRLPFPGLARLTEVGFVATLTFENGPVPGEDGNDTEPEVLREPSLGMKLNEDLGTRAKPISSHGCNRDRG
jgi:hypothetical protein